MDPSVNMPSDPPTRVMIIDDHTSIRDMLVTLVRTLPGFDVVADAGDVGEGVRLAEELRPDVVVLDWMFPGGGGIEFLRRIKAGALQPNVLIFSAITSELAIREALTNGAKGYVEKGASFAAFVEALRAVAAGKVCFGPTVARVVDRLVSPEARGAELNALSARECEVLRCIGEGLSSKEIAARLGISVLTVNNHRASIASKTQLHSIAELTMHAARLGLIPGPEEFALPSQPEHAVAS